MSSQEKFIVGFYNVENLFDIEDDPETDDGDFTPSGRLKWDDVRFGRKIRNLCQVLLTLGDRAPSLMGLAEVENADVLAHLQEELNWQGMGLDYIHEESPDERGIDVALLYNPETFQYEDHCTHSVHFEFDVEDKTRDILHVWGKLGGSRVHVFVNHWPSRSEGVEESEPKRIEAANVLRKEVDALLESNPEERIIIMGDMNDYPTDHSITQTLRANSHPIYDRGDLLNLSFNPHFRGEGSHVHKGDWGMLDHLIISEALARNEEGLRLKSQEVEIVDDEWLIYRKRRGKSKGSKPNRTYAGKKYHGGFSDHLPIYIELIV